MKEERVIVLEYLQSIVAKNIYFFFWVLLVDCVGVSELIMILYIFLLVWMLRK